jgi:hypothetical protein
MCLSVLSVRAFLCMCRKREFCSGFFKRFRWSVYVSNVHACVCVYVWGGGVGVVGVGVL